MKAVATLVLILSCLNCFCQSKTDYEIYSQVVENKFNELDRNKRFSNKAIIIDREKEQAQWAAEGYNFIDFAFFDNPIDSLTKEEVKTLILSLTDPANEAPVLHVERFKTTVTLQLIQRDSFDSLFKKDIKSGWNKFYRMYPKSIGAFSFSKIMYTSDTAVLFVDFARNGLNGSGDFYILKNVGGKWVIDNKFNIYKA